MTLINCILSFDSNIGIDHLTLVCRKYLLEATEEATIAYNKAVCSSLPVIREHVNL